MSEQDERAAMIEAARDFLDDEPTWGFRKDSDFTMETAVCLLAPFALVQTADLREQLRVAKEALRELPNLVPTNWCDPLLTGPDAVFTDEPSCRDIEALLRGIQDRQREALARLDASQKETAG